MLLNCPIKQCYLDHMYQIYTYAFLEYAYVLIFITYSNSSVSSGYSSIPFLNSQSPSLKKSK